MRRIAYIRVSTCEQRPDRQIDGLREFCDEVHIEALPAVSRQRPVYNEVMERLRPGDVFVIWDLDRAFRSTRDALTELEILRERDIAIHIANLNIDTATPHGLLIYTIISAMAEFERRLLSQRTKEGLAAARRRGQRLGRPPKISQAQIISAKSKIEAGQCSLQTMAKKFGVSSWTLIRNLKRLETTDS